MSKKNKKDRKSFTRIYENQLIIKKFYNYNASEKWENKNMYLYKEMNELGEIIQKKLGLDMKKTEKKQACRCRNDYFGAGFGGDRAIETYDS